MELINHRRTPSPFKDESDKAECDQNQMPSQLLHELGSETESRLSDSRPHLEGSPIREVMAHDELPEDLKPIEQQPVPIRPRPSIEAENVPRLSETSIKRIERQQTHDEGDETIFRELEYSLKNHFLIAAQRQSNQIASRHHYRGCGVFSRQIPLDPGR